MGDSGDPKRSGGGGRVVFGLSLVALALGAAFAGAMIWPLLGGNRSAPARPALESPGEIAAFLEHAAVDVRLGRGAAVADALAALAARPLDRSTAERVLGLWAEAATQARDMSAAATALEQLDAVVTDPERRLAVRMQRIAVLGALGDRKGATALADLIVADANDPALADAARLRLAASTMTPDELRGWVAATNADDADAARRAGLAALRLLSDPGAAEPLLAAARRAGAGDVALLAALADTYSALQQPKELAAVLDALAAAVPESDRPTVQLRRAEALGAAGDADAALAATDQLLGSSRQIEVRRAARRLRYRLMQQSGRLDAEIALVDKRGDAASRAFIALEIERDYAMAATLYAELAAADPDSVELARGLQVARQSVEAMEARALYAKVLEKDPADRGAIEKFLRATVQLGDVDQADAVIQRLVQGREKDPAALLDVAKLVFAAGMDKRAADLLRRAYEAEQEPRTKQQILFVLADLYSESSQIEMARRVYTDLAASGMSREIREQALARLAALVAK